MSLKQWINLALLMFVLVVLAYEAVRLLMGDWLTRREPSLTDAEVMRLFAQVRTEVESGCTCEGCVYIRGVLAASAGGAS